MRGRAELKSGETLAIQYNYFIVSQNTLQMNVINNNYSDPNNLMFQEIKILGLQQELMTVTVLQENVEQVSSHNITYNPTDKVKNGRKTGIIIFWSRIY